MGIVIKLPNSPYGVIRTELSQVLDSREYAFVQEVMDGYYFRKTGGKNNEAKTVKANVLVIQDFIAFCRKAPWNITTADFDRWCSHLSKERKRRSSTERKYQGIIQGFYHFLKNEEVITVKLKEQFGVSKVRQIVNRDNRIAHTTEDESQSTRADVPEDHVNLIFRTYEENIKIAYRDHNKTLYPLLRDRAMFYLIYSCGLRASEALRLNIESFMPNPEFPEFGEYGFIIVFGKGSKGSGLRRRDVIVEDPKLPELLAAYMKYIRPRFLNNCTIGERAIFLSNWGKRLSLASLEARFDKIRKLANLEDYAYVPHCLRHSSVTEKLMEYSLEATRRMHGHLLSNTTQGYAHVKDKYIADEIKKRIRANIANYKKMKEGRKNED